MEGFAAFGDTRKPLIRQCEVMSDFNKMYTFLNGKYINIMLVPQLILHRFLVSSLCILAILPRGS